MHDLIILIVSLAIILILFKCKVNLTLTMIVAALFLGIAYRFSLTEILKTFYTACLSRETLEIAATLFLVIIFNLSMSAAYTFRHKVGYRRYPGSDRFSSHVWWSARFCSSGKGNYSGDGHIQ